MLDALSGYTTDYLVSPDNWQASVEATTGLRLFRSGTLVNVVERLSRLCGPLLVFPATGARPLLVTPGMDPMDAVKVWEIA